MVLYLRIQQNNYPNILVLNLTGKADLKRMDISMPYQIIVSTKSGKI